MNDVMTMSWSNAVSWIGLASVQSLVVIALVMLCRRLLAHRLSAQAIYSLWLAVVICLAVPFGMQVQLQLPDMGTNAAAVVRAMEVAQPVVAAVDGAAAGQFSYSVSEPTGAAIMSNGAWLLLLWAGGAGITLTAMLWNLVRYLRIKALARPLAPRHRALLMQCRQQSGLSREVQLLETSSVQSPAVFGWWSPTILLPAGLTNQLSDTQLRHVFLHELAHVRRHDVLVNWLIALVQVLHWFNPCVWLALRTMRADMERACDASVMSQLAQCERLDYGHTLIRLTDLYPASTALAQGAGIVERHSQLKGRIEMISSYTPSRIRYSLLAVVVLVAVTSVALIRPMPTEAAATPRSDDRIVVSFEKPTYPVATVAAPQIRPDVVSGIGKLDAPRLLVAAADAVQGAASGDDHGNPVFVDVHAIVAEVSADMASRLGIVWTSQQPANSAGVGMLPAAGVGMLSAGSPKDFGALLSALRGDSNSKVIATPRMIIPGDKEASVQIGRQVPFVGGPLTDRTGEPAAQTLQRMEIGTLLRIIPQIGQGDAVTLRISQETSRMAPDVVPGGDTMVINKRTVTTKVLVESGGTLVMVGLIDKDAGVAENRRAGDANVMLFIHPTVRHDMPQPLAANSNHASL